MNAALGILLAGTRVNRRRAASGSRTATTGSLAAARKTTTAASPTSRRDAGFQSSTSAVTGTRNQCRFATEEKISSCPTGTRSTAAATTPRRAAERITPLSARYVTSASALVSSAAPIAIDAAAQCRGSIATAAVSSRGSRWLYPAHGSSSVAGIPRS